MTDNKNFSENLEKETEQILLNLDNDQDIEIVLKFFSNVYDLNRIRAFPYFESFFIKVNDKFIEMANEFVHDSRIRELILKFLELILSNIKRIGLEEIEGKYRSPDLDYLHHIFINLFMSCHKDKMFSKEFIKLLNGLDTEKKESFIKRCFKPVINPSKKHKKEILEVFDKDIISEIRKVGGI